MRWALGVWEKLSTHEMFFTSMIDGDRRRKQLRRSEFHLVIQYTFLGSSITMTEEEEDELDTN